MNNYKSDIKLFKKLCSMNVKQLQFFLYKTLKANGYSKIIQNKNFLIAEGNLPICLCAHMDTVFSRTPNIFYYDQEAFILWSPTGMGADDRAGILIILKLLLLGYCPSIIFTDLEEEGGQGAQTLVGTYGNCPFENCRYLIQLDRRGEKDAVYYSCDNKEFEKLITSYGFETDIGTFSDISILAPIWEKVAVNLSVGYNYEHTNSEILNFYNLNQTYIKLIKMLQECEGWNDYKYIEKQYNYSNLFDYFEEKAKNKCVCCGDELKEYYSYNYDGEVFKVCPYCYKNIFCPTE